ncbi:MAG: CapA family protein [Clostridia bacterium]
MGKDRANKNSRDKIRRRKEDKTGLNKIRNKLEAASLDLEDIKKKSKKVAPKTMYDPMYDYEANKDITMIIANKEFAPELPPESKAKEAKKAKMKELALKKEEKLNNEKVRSDKQKYKPANVSYDNTYKEKKSSTAKRSILAFCLIALFILGCTFLVKNAASNVVEKAKGETKKNVQEVNPSVDLDKTKGQKDAEKLNETFGLNNNQNAELNLTFLGDIILPSSLPKTTEEYCMAVKDIAFLTSKADYTVGILPSVITNADFSEGGHSQYITPKESISAFKSLGVNLINLANDTILDYGDYMAKATAEALKTEGITTVGLNDSIAYFAQNGIRIAVVSYNDIIIGTKSKYETAGISMYSEDKAARDIAEAKRNADVVIVTVHYGKASKNEITNIMTDIARKTVDAGADMFVGSHAMGVLPVEIYKGKPIIYSIGHLIGNAENETARQSATVDVNISKDFKIKKITLNPIYITEKETIRATDVNLQQFLDKMAQGCTKLSTPFEIVEDKFIINIKN